MKRLVALILAVLLAMPFLSGCRGSGKTDGKLMLEKIREAHGELPAGRVYHSEAEEGDPEFLSLHKLEGLYGKKHISVCLPLVSHWAIYLSSFALPWEMAVFVCHSKSDTDTVAKMCFARGDIIKAYILHREEYSHISAEVWVKDNIVAMYVGGSPMEAERAFMRG